MISSRASVIGFVSPSQPLLFQRSAATICKPSRSRGQFELKAEVDTNNKVLSDGVPKSTKAGEQGIRNRSNMATRGGPRQQGGRGGRGARGRGPVQGRGRGAADQRVQAPRGQQQQQQQTQTRAPTLNITPQLPHPLPVFHPSCFLEPISEEIDSEPISRQDAGVIAQIETVLEDCRKGGGADEQLKRARAVSEALGSLSPTPPRQAFDLALQVAAQSRTWEMAIEVLDLMQAASIKPTCEMCKNLLRAWNGSKDAQVSYVMRVLDTCVKEHVHLDLEILELATALCARGGGVTEALFFLGQANHVGLIATEKMYEDSVGALCQSGRWQRGKDLVREAAVTLGMPLSSMSYTAVIRAAGRAGHWRAAVQMLSEMEAGRAKGGWREESWPTAQTYNAVISACAQGSGAAYEHGLEILARMQEGAYARTPTLACYNAAMAGCERARQPQQALDLLTSLLDKGIKPDVITFNTAISACAKGNRWETALSLLAKMSEMGIKPDKISYNSAIAACASVAASEPKAFKKSQDLLANMNRAGLKPDKFSYASAINACARAKDSTKALRLLFQMKMNKVPPDVVAYTSCLDACASTGMWKEGLALLEEMRLNRIQPNERTYRAAISACGKGGNWQRSLDLLAEMRLRGLSISTIIYNSAITACQKGGQSQPALSLFDQMKSDGRQPDLFTYSAVIGACAVEGRSEDAIRLLRELETGVNAGMGMQANVIVYTAAISACGRAGDASGAMTLLAEMRAGGLVPDTVCFNAAINACRRSGKYQDAIDLLKEMEDLGLQPDLATVTDMVNALTEGDMVNEADAVYARGEASGALPSSTLDSDWELDISTLPPSVARAKVRSVMARILLGATSSPSSDSSNADLSKPKRRRTQDLILVCGTGVQRSTHGSASRRFDMRGFMKECLRSEYTPPLPTTTPPFLSGCVCVPADALQAWVDAQVS